jgi:hypothetical protein
VAKLKSDDKDRKTNCEPPLPNSSFPESTDDSSVTLVTPSGYQGGDDFVEIVCDIHVMEPFEGDINDLIASRITFPNLEIPAQVNSTGTGLINIFASDLFDFIDKGLKKTKGQNWLIELEVQNIGSEQNFRDPSVLLKELAQKGQSPLRGPVTAIVPQANWKDFYKRIDDLLGERHLWVHNSIKADADQLKSLAILVNKIAWTLELPVVKECQALLEHITPDEPEEFADEIEPVAAPSEIAAELGRFTSDDEAAVGSPIAGSFISHSYTLHMNGSVRDRGTDELLGELIPDGDTLGALLIARKPSGGRLRVTESGEIAAYFGDSWGFLAKVEPKTWFPGHLS